MLDATEIGCGALMIVALVAGMGSCVHTNFIKEHKYIDLRAVEVPASTAESVTTEGQGGMGDLRQITFKLPAQSKQTLQMAVVEPASGEMEISRLGYRYATVQECRAFLPKQPKEGKYGQPATFCCFGSWAEQPYGSYSATLKFDKKLNRYEVFGLNTHDHFGGVKLSCDSRYVGVKK